MNAPNTGLTLSLRAFLSGILDIHFKRYLSMQLLPLFYMLLLLGTAGALVFLTVLVFWFVPWAGMILLLLTPLAFLVAAAVIRAALEFLVMAYRIMETVNNMQQIPAQVDNLNAKVDHISAGFDPIPNDVNHLKGRVDELHQTLGLLQPLLKILHFPFGGRPHR